VLRDVFPPGVPMRRFFRPLAVVAPIVLVACLDPEPVPETNYGIIGLTTVPSTNDTILSPQAVFYRTGPLGLPTSRLSTDLCQLVNYPTPSGSTDLPRFLDAGDSVAVSTGTSTKYLFPIIDGDGESYVLKTGDRFPFHPGEQVTITVPGVAGGFANGTISVETARGFTMGPIDPSPPPDEGLDLTWSPAAAAGDDSTKILISLQYGTGQVEPNEQIFCSLVDDGSAEVPSVFAARWRAATTGSRRFEAARWRVVAKEVSGGILLVVSAFEIESVID
jgi:hypothetical protein